MSLETQIAALVTAANNLTNAVNSKMGEIDAAVLAAVQAIPDMLKSLYVDSVDGSDAAQGTSAAPLKTIAEAMARTSTTPYAYIYLKAGQTHEYNGVSNSIPYRSVSNKLVFDRYGSGNNPVFTPRVGNYMAGYSNLHFFVLEGGSVFFRNTDITIPNALLNGTAAWYELFGTSLFFRAHGGSVPLQGSVTIAYGTLILGARNVFQSGYSGNYLVDISNTTINAGLSSLFAELTSSTMVLAVHGVTITNSKAWPDLIKGVIKDSGGSLCNLVSNIGNQLAGV